jgi:hypothetical protein
MSFEYTTFALSEIAAADLLMEAAQAGLFACVAQGPIAFATAQTEFNAACALRDQVHEAHEPLCTCCRKGFSYVDRWGGCLCDTGECTKCGGDDDVQCEMCGYQTPLQHTSLLSGYRHCRPCEREALAD